MISRAQGKTMAAEVAVRKQLKLSGLEKAMLRWAVVDPEDKLLDANIGSGMMAEYLRRNMQCEVCGVSDNMEHVRQSRSRLRSCDIVYAPPGDIPWRSESFDTIFMKYHGEENDTLIRVLSEAERVLKAGGQLILGAVCFPSAVNAITGMFADESMEERRPFRRDAVVEMLHSCRFEKVTWQRTGFGTGVLIAWKKKPEVDALRNAG